MKIKILVTGANGQLGNEIQSISQNYPLLDFVFTDVAELDITNRDKCLSFIQNLSPHYIINCAAYTAVDKAEQDAESAFKINTWAVKYIAEACNIVNAKLIHISTDYVFNGQHYRPYNETDRTDPLSVYGQTKSEGELAALTYEKTIIIRASWLYSSFGNNFVKTMLRLGSEKESINVVFDQIGTPTYANDLAETTLHIINNDIAQSCAFTSGIYHYSNEGVCSWYDFAIEILNKAGSKCVVLPVESKDFPTLAQRPFYSVLNKHKIKSTFGIKIPYWKDSLDKCLKILLNN